MYFLHASTKHHSSGWDGYYKQLQGAAMGSPLSPIVANIFMEEFKTSALQPKLWLRYVDDTFIIWQHSKQQLDNFFQHLNNQQSNIKFTMETEDQRSLPFLDVRITMATDCHLNTSSLQEANAYRQIPSLQIIPPPISSTISLQHTHQTGHTTSETSNTFNKNFNTSSLHSPPSTMDTLVGRSRYGHQDPSQPHQPSQESPCPTWAKTSHKLQRILKTVNIEVRHRSSNKLHSSLHTHKDRKHKNTQQGIYKIRTMRMRQSLHRGNREKLQHQN